jgi:hypothetical protein
VNEKESTPPLCVGPVGWYWKLPAMVGSLLDMCLGGGGAKKT